MIQAVIFDCFGVLTTDGWLPFKQRHFGSSPDLFERATALNKLVDSGLADYNDFIFSVAELAGVPPAEARAQIEDNVANDPLFEYIQAELKPRYSIGLLSNAGANWLGDLFGPGQVALFDAVSLSCDTGFLKPDVRAYQEIANKLGVEVQECVFVDDQERFCTAAREAGMQAVWYNDFNQLKAELDEFLKTKA